MATATLVRAGARAGRLRIDRVDPITASGDLAEQVQRASGESERRHYAATLRAARNSRVPSDMRAAMRPAM